MKCVPEGDSGKCGHGTLGLYEAAVYEPRVSWHWNQTECCIAHHLNLLSLFPVQSHHLVLRAQDASEGLNPQTPENGVSTDVILRDATKCTQKVLT